VIKPAITGQEAEVPLTWYGLLQASATQNWWIRRGL